MKNLLFVAHTPSENTKELANSLFLAAKPVGESLCVEHFSPYEVDKSTLESADGVILFTTENFGYMSGALKDMFDRLYYHVIDSKRGLPYCLVVRAGKDGTGTVRAVESITKGLGWKRVQAPLILTGEYRRSEFIHQISELGQGFAEALLEGII